MEILIQTNKGSRGTGPRATVKPILCRASSPDLDLFEISPVCDQAIANYRFGLRRARTTDIRITESSGIFFQRTFDKRKLSVEYGGLDWVREAKANFSEKIAEKLLLSEGKGEAKKPFKAANQKADQVFEDLVSKAEAVVKLNQELENFLYRSETSKFYADGAAAGFKQIKTSAIAAAKAKLQLPQGTPQEICHTVDQALAAVHSAYKEFGEKPPAHLPKDLSDSSNKIVEPFLKAAKTLGEIESATWDKEDTQNRILATKVTYTCAITPKVEGTKQLPASKLKVTVKGVADGWIIKFTQGPFLSRLRDKPYRLEEDVAMNCATSSEANSGMSAPAFMDMTAETDANAVPMGNANTEIKRKIMAGGPEDFVTTSLGALVHVSHSKCKWGGLSGGLGRDGANNMQVALGLSFFFNTQDEQSFALTFGGIAGKVKDLDGYAEGDFFKGTGSLPTKLVTRVNWFGAITFNFTSLLGSGQTGTPN